MQIMKSVQCIVQISEFCGIDVCVQETLYVENIVLSDWLDDKGKELDLTFIVSISFSLIYIILLIISGDGAMDR